MAEINKNTTLAEILKMPKTENILIKHNLPCMGCPFAKMEMENLKIGDICQAYGINLKNLLKDLKSRTKKRKA